MELIPMDCGINCTLMRPFSGSDKITRMKNRVGKLNTEGKKFKVITSLIRIQGE